MLKLGPHTHIYLVPLPYTQVCVLVVPASDRCGADFLNVEVRADNLQGLLPAPGAMAVLEEQSTREPQVRAAGASCTAQ